MRSQRKKRRGYRRPRVFNYGGLLMTKEAAIGWGLEPVPF